MEELKNEKRKGPKRTLLSILALVTKASRDSRYGKDDYFTLDVYRQAKALTAEWLPDIENELRERGLSGAQHEEASAPQQGREITGQLPGLASIAMSLLRRPKGEGSKRSKRKDAFLLTMHRAITHYMHEAEAEIVRLESRLSGRRDGLRGQEGDERDPLLMTRAGLGGSEHDGEPGSAEPHARAHGDGDLASEMGSLRSAVSGRSTPTHDSLADSPASSRNTESYLDEFSPPPDGLHALSPIPEQSQESLRGISGPGHEGSASEYFAPNTAEGAPPWNARSSPSRGPPQPVPVVNLVPPNEEPQYEQPYGESERSARRSRPAESRQPTPSPLESSSTGDRYAAEAPQVMDAPHVPQQYQASHAMSTASSRRSRRSWTSQSPTTDAGPSGQYGGEEPDRNAASIARHQDAESMCASLHSGASSEFGSTSRSPDALQPPVPSRRSTSTHTRSSKRSDTMGLDPAAPQEQHDQCDGSRYSAASTATGSERPHQTSQHQRDTSYGTTPETNPAYAWKPPGYDDDGDGDEDDDDASRQSTRGTVAATMSSQASQASTQCTLTPPAAGPTVSSRKKPGAKTGR